MADLFSASELINVAIREEVTGAAYYRAVAEKAGSDELKRFALEVAEMEDRHAAQFRGLLAEVGPYRPSGEQYDGQYEEYIAYLVEGRIFPLGEDAAEMAARQGSDLEAVEAAAEMEKNTLVLYQELRNFVPEAQRPLLEAIINEEQQHLLMFTRFKEGEPSR